MKYFYKTFLCTRDASCQLQDVRAQLRGLGERVEQSTLQLSLLGPGIQPSHWSS